MSLVLALLALLAPDGLPAGPPAGPGEAEFDRAAQLIAAEQYEPAARVLLDVAAAEPRSRYFDDALFTAGQLFEERLGDPVRALRLYERLIAESPNSRLALAATRRAERLRSDLGPDGADAAVLSRFNRIRQEFPGRDVAESVAEMARLLDEYPEWVGEPRAALWLAQVHHRRGDLDRALEYYQQVIDRWPQAAAGFDARLGIAEISVARGDLDRARRSIGGIAIDGDPGRARAVEAALEGLARERWRAKLYWLSWVAALFALLALLALLWRATGAWPAAARALWPPPVEAIYFAPVAIVLVGAAATSHEQIAPAAAIVLSAGFAVTWLSAGGLRAARQPSGLRVALHALVAGVGVIAWLYIAVHRTRLLDAILVTVRFGHD